MGWYADGWKESDLGRLHAFFAMALDGKAMILEEEKAERIWRSCGIKYRR